MILCNSWTVWCHLLREELAADQERVGKLFQRADASTWVSQRTIVSKALWQDQERLLEIHFPVHLLSGLPLHVACAVWRENACQHHRQRQQAVCQGGSRQWGRRVLYITDDGVRLRSDRRADRKENQCSAGSE